MKTSSLTLEKACQDGQLSDIVTR